MLQRWLRPSSPCLWMETGSSKQLPTLWKLTLACVPLSRISRIAAKPQSTDWTRHQQKIPTTSAHRTRAQFRLRSFATVSATTFSDKQARRRPSSLTTTLPCLSQSDFPGSTHPCTTTQTLPFFLAFNCHLAETLFSLGYFQDLSLLGLP